MNFNDIFKKLCNVGLATAMSIGLFAITANAAPPTAANKGKLIDGSVTINTKDITGTNGKDATLMVTLNGEHTYDGNPYNIIKSITYDPLLESGGATIYLRVADTQDANPEDTTQEDEGVAADTPKAWVKFDYSKKDFIQYYSNLKRTEKGTYYVFFYIDGGNNFKDVDGTNPAS